MKRILPPLALTLVLATPASAKPLLGLFGKSRPAEGFEATLPAPAPQQQPQAATGSIFNVNGGYAALVAGNRAHAVGDPLTIVLMENTTTSKSAGSRTQRNGGFSLTPPTTGPFSFNPSALNASGQSSFKGDGNATQSSSLEGEISVTIAEVRPNGTALVRGEKRMLLSQGREWIQFSGIVRLADIDQNNRISSSQVADAHIEYAGNGPTQRASREGWLSKFFNMVTPF